MKITDFVMFPISKKDDHQRATKYFVTYIMKKGCKYRSVYLVRVIEGKG